MKKFTTSLFTAIALGVATSHGALYTLSGAMDPLQAGTNGGFGNHAPGAGNGSGTISGDYDDVANILNYSITWQNLSAPETVAHFHVAPPGSGGGVTLGISASSPSIGNNISLSEAQEGQLLSGNWYVNIHTQAFTGGEIRGQIITTVVPEAGTSALALGGLGLLFLRRRRA